MTDAELLSHATNALARVREELLRLESVVETLRRGRAHLRVVTKPDLEEL